MEIHGFPVDLKIKHVYRLPVNCISSIESMRIGFVYVDAFGEHAHTPLDSNRT